MTGPTQQVDSSRIFVTVSESRPPDVLRVVVPNLPFARAHIRIVGGVSVELPRFGSLPPTGPSTRDSTPGCHACVRPDVLVSSLPVIYPGVDTSALRTDPHISRAIHACSMAQLARLPTVEVFLPLPMALQPQLEIAARPVAPNADDASHNHSAALDRPPERRGVSMKPSEARPAEKDALAQPREQLADAKNAAPRPPTADATIGRQHDGYLNARGDLQQAIARAQQPPADSRAEARDVSLAPPKDHDGAPPTREGRALEPTRNPERLLDQIGRLDASARDFFGRPGWQREASFQRAMLLSLFAGGMQLEAAHTQLFQLFGGRMNIDLDQLSKLAMSYGLVETPAIAATSADAKTADPNALMKDAQAALRDKAKLGRLPEEMLMQQQRPGEITGGKRKIKGTLDRVENVDGERHSAADEEGDEAQHEDAATPELPDEEAEAATGPILIDKKSS